MAVPCSEDRYCAIGSFKGGERAPVARRWTAFLFLGDEVVDIGIGASYNKAPMVDLGSRCCCSCFVPKAGRMGSNGRQHVSCYVLNYAQCACPVPAAEQVHADV